MADRTMSWRPSRFWVCAPILVALGLFAISGGRQVLAEKPAPQSSKRATADETKPLDPSVKADNDPPIDLKADSVIARIGDSEQILLGEVIADVNKRFAETALHVSARTARDVA